MTRPTFRLRVLAFLAALVAPALLRADAPSNVPQFCRAQTQKCTSCHGDIANECVLLSLDLGETTPWTGSMPVHLKVRTSEASPSLSTPSQLKLVLGYTFMHLGPETPGGGSENAVTFSDEAGRSLEFRFESGSSVGVPRFVMGGDAQVRLQMVDAEGWATLSDPAFFDLYPGDGSVWRYVASPAAADFGALARYVNPRGAAYTWDDMGVAVLRDASGFLRQVATRTRLADIVVHSATHYTVTVYPLTEDPQTDPDTGLLVPPPHDPVRVLDVRRGTTDRELIVGYQKGTGDMRTYRYVAKNGDWELTNPSGLVDANELYFTEDENGARRIHVWKDSDGTPLRRMEANFIDAPWGWAMTNFVEGIPGDATRTTSWSYFESGPHQGLVQEQITPTGNRIVYEYDDKNRVVRESMPLVEEETLYSYAPVAPSDPPLLCDTRPRCVVRKMQGVEIQRTYYVYGTNGVDVVERVGEQGAAYGGTNVLRTVTTYYPVTGAVTDGLVKSVRHEDGTSYLFEYHVENGTWFVTTTRHLGSGDASDFNCKSIRTIIVFNSLGQVVERRKEILPFNSDWVLIARMSFSYDVFGNVVSGLDSIGRQSTATWGQSCCGKISDKNWGMPEMLFASDAEGNTIEIKELDNDLVKLFQYDNLGRLTNSIATNHSGNETINLSEIRYDGLDRNIYIKNWNSPAQSFVYSLNGLQTDIIEPSGARTITRKRFDGIVEYEKTKSGLEMYHSFGVLSNGVRIIRTTIGHDDSSPRFRERLVNMFGLPIEDRKSAFSATITTNRYSYDSFGRISEKTTASGNQVFFYNDVGMVSAIKQVRPHSWRMTEFSPCFSWDNGTFWFFIEKTTSCSDSSIVPIKERDACQITGQTLARYHVSRHDDRYGNTFLSWDEYDENSKSIVHFRQLPFSDLPLRSVSRNGRTMTIKNTLGGETTFSHDYLGRIIEIVDTETGNANQYSYSIDGTRVQRTTETGEKWIFRLSPEQLISEEINPLGQVLTNRYDMIGRILSRSGRVHDVSYNYDEWGNLSEQSTSRDGVTSDTTSWVFDPSSDLICEKIYPDGSSTKKWYSTSGKLQSELTARGIILTYEYDEWGNLTTVHYSDETPDVHYCWNAMGQLVSASSDNGSESKFQYDDFGNLTNEVQNGVRIYRKYDSQGRIQAMICDDQIASRYQYDSSGRVEIIENGDISATYRYRGQSNIPAETKLSNGLEWQYRSSATQKSASGYIVKTNGIDCVRRQWERDELGRIVHEIVFSDSAVTTNSYQYNEWGELARAQVGNHDYEYQYDQAGNMVFRRNGDHEVRFGINELDQCSTIDQEAILAYDEDGNLLQDSRGNYFAWDANGFLTSISNANSSIRFEYDPFGRVHKAVIGSTNVFVCWNGNTPICVLTFDGSVTATNTFLWGIGINGSLDQSGGVGALLSVKTPYGTSFPVYDGRGSVIAYYINATNFEFNEMRGPYGEKIGFRPNVFPIGFSTKWQNDPLGIVFFQKRLYSTFLCRWISRDTSGLMDEINLYTYVKGDPVNSVDYLGLWGCSPNPPCCDSKPYNPETHCCITDDDNGIYLIPRQTVDTGVATYKYSQWDKHQNRPFVHHWISWGASDDQTADANGDSSPESNGHGSGRVHIPALGKRPWLAGVERNAIALSPCEYDISCFSSCIETTAEEYKKSQAIMECDDFVDAIVSSCKSKCKGSDKSYGETLRKPQRSAEEEELDEKLQKLLEEALSDPPFENAEENISPPGVSPIIIDPVTNLCPKGFI